MMKRAFSYLSSYLAAAVILCACGGNAFELVTIDTGDDGGDIAPAPGALVKAPGAFTAPRGGALAPDAPASAHTDAPAAPTPEAGAPDSAPAPDVSTPDVSTPDVASPPPPPPLVDAAVDVPPPPPPPPPPTTLCCVTGPQMVTACSSGYQCFADAAGSSCSAQALPDGGQVETCTSTATPIGSCTSAGASGACTVGDYCVATDHSTAGYVRSCP